MSGFGGKKSRLAHIKQNSIAEIVSAMEFFYLEEYRKTNAIATPYKQILERVY